MLREDVDPTRWQWSFQWCSTLRLLAPDHSAKTHPTDHLLTRCTGEGPGVGEGVYQECTSAVLVPFWESESCGDFFFLLVSTTARVGPYSLETLLVFNRCPWFYIFLMKKCARAFGQFASVVCFRPRWEGRYFGNEHLLSCVAWNIALSLHHFL